VPCCNTSSMPESAAVGRIHGTEASTAPSEKAVGRIHGTEASTAPSEKAVGRIHGTVTSTAPLKRLLAESMAQRRAPRLLKRTHRTNRVDRSGTQCYSSSTSPLASHHCQHCCQHCCQHSQHQHLPCQHSIWRGCSCSCERFGQAEQTYLGASSATTELGGVPQVLGSSHQ
jgi:hypothetical protein